MKKRKNQPKINLNKGVIRRVPIFVGKREAHAAKFKTSIP